MRTIFKYELAVTDDRQSVQMPKGAILRAVQLQYGAVTIWAEVESENPREKRSFRVYGTGNPIEQERDVYVGTVQTPPFVWHVYEVVE